MGRQGGAAPLPKDLVDLAAGVSSIILCWRFGCCSAELNTIDLARRNRKVMGTKATVYKAELEISDIDRGYYATHNLILAQHPSENDRRLMARLITFALFAEEGLEFGRGLSNEEEPALWQRDLTGGIVKWIELGQPDESAVRRASGKAQQVILVTYSGNSAEVWWSKNQNAFGRLKNLIVLDLDVDEVETATHLLERTMRLQVMLQEGVCQLMRGDITASIRPRILLDSTRA
jgi:uncharacterized protein YaeQ